MQRQHHRLGADPAVRTGHADLYQVKRQYRVQRRLGPLARLVPDGAVILLDGLVELGRRRKIAGATRAASRDACRATLADG